MNRRRLEGRRDGDPGIGHLEGVHAVADLGERDGRAVCFLNRQAVQHIAGVGGDRDGHEFALVGANGTHSDCAAVSGSIQGNQVTAAGAGGVIHDGRGILGHRHGTLGTGGQMVDIPLILNGESVVCRGIGESYGVSAIAGVENAAVTGYGNSRVLRKSALINGQGDRAAAGEGGGFCCDANACGCLFNGDRNIHKEGCVIRGCDGNDLIISPDAKIFCRLDTHSAVNYIN